MLAMPILLRPASDLRQSRRYPTSPASGPRPGMSGGDTPESRLMGTSMYGKSNKTSLMQMKYLLSTVLCCWGVAYALPAAAECAPDCDYSTCGDDGCGGSCGGCDGACIDGRCVTDCWLLPEVGCCLGNQLVWCVDDEVLTSSCDKYPSCGWSGLWGGYSCNSTGEAEPSGTWAQECSALCTPDCEGRECGDDACGGLCGKCPAGEGCNDGVCCVGDCTGKQCGSDGCVGVCPDTCPEGQGCLNGECCVPNCENRECGSDGCDGSCGECEEGICDDGGVCRKSCSGFHMITCCDGDYLVYCLFDELTKAKCPGGWACAWGEEAGKYACLPPPIGEPSATHTGKCEFDACEPKCPVSGPACGDDGCAGSCGTCLEGQVCFNKKCCTPWCGGKECGNDGCGGTCGDCPAGQWECAAGECVQVYGSEETKQAGCGGCKCEECVCLVRAECCDVEWDLGCDTICESICGGGGPCAPDCSGRQCGDDGCGGICGSCAEGQVCIESGACCFPDCHGRECGDDGCGGFCGTKTDRNAGKCEVGAKCVGGKCLAECEDQCMGIQCGEFGEAACGGSCGFCQATQVCFDGKCYSEHAGVGSSGCCVNEDLAVKWVGMFDGEKLYINKCEHDEYCGFMPEYEWCYIDPATCEYYGQYQCVPEAWPYRSAPLHAGSLSAPPPRDCAPTCPSGPQCEGRTCGPDGCGATCGECSTGMICVDGTCTKDPCEPGACGPDGKGHYCSACPAGSRCNFDYECEPCPVDACAGRECGPDGCGGYCGTCPGTGTCVSGTCVEVCEGIHRLTGCCDGNAVVRCDDLPMVKMDCGPNGPACGYSVEKRRYECGGELLFEESSGPEARKCLRVPVANCINRECGPNGTGGTCGTCDPGQECLFGRCEGDAIVPDGEPDAGRVEETSTAPSCSNGCRMSREQEGKPGSGTLILLLLWAVAVTWRLARKASSRAR